jgi:hypothetical protein
MASHRIFLCWPGRPDPVPALAGQIHGFLSQASALHPKLAGFLFQPRGGAPEPAASAAACEEALRAAAGTWQSGGREITSYAPRFFLERAFAPPVEVTLTCGIPPLGLDAIFTPNRLDLRVRAGDERAQRPVLEGLLRASSISASRAAAQRAAALSQARRRRPRRLSTSSPCSAGKCRSVAVTSA